MIQEIQGAVFWPVGGDHGGVVIGGAEERVLPLIAVAAGKRRTASVGYLRLELTPIDAVTGERRSDRAAVAEQPIRMEVERDAPVVADEPTDRIDISDIADPSDRDVVRALAGCSDVRERCRLAICQHGQVVGQVRQFCQDRLGVGPRWP